MKNFRTYNVIGLMSGTSLDGLDVAFCNFNLTTNHSPNGGGNKWEYKILAAKTYPYNQEWKEKLATVEKKTAEELAQLHSEYGHFIGKIVKKFIEENKVKAHFVSSHGHTIFHQPFLKSREFAPTDIVGGSSETKSKIAFTFQLGSGATIAAECGLPVVCDFRTADVALGGQGAPLVPIGDELLFSDYDFCLNIGGIANVTRQKTEDGRRKKKNSSVLTLAYDICPANIVLNFLAKKHGKEFDKNGEIARAGKVNEKLFKELNSLKYYSLKPPKSLGKEWIVKNFFPVLEKYKISIEDKLRTVVEHIAVQISSEFAPNAFGGSSETKKTQNSKLKTVSELRPPDYKLLITGGGAHNKFLMERIKNLTLTLSKGEGKTKMTSFAPVLFKCPPDICRPDKLTVNFKEALIFAFLSVLRWRGENNCLASVTGAKRDNCGGAIYFS